MDVVISVNVHEKVDFLYKQLENIKQYMKCSYVVVLNCNHYMYHELSSVTLPNVFINPVILTKRTFSGTLTHGIYSNMQYAMNRFAFKYFLVLSSRNVFYQPLTLEILNKKQGIASCIEEIEHPVPNYTTWWWPEMVKTELAKYYFQRGKHLSKALHEGLVLHYFVCQNIIRFLESHPYIRLNLFMFPHCVEEFSFHTIAMNEVNPDNLYYGYFMINRTCETDYEVPTDPEWFVYKTLRT